MICLLFENSMYPFILKKRNQQNQRDIIATYDRTRHAFWKDLKEQKPNKPTINKNDFLPYRIANECIIDPQILDPIDSRTHTGTGIEYEVVTIVDDQGPASCCIIRTSEEGSAGTRKVLRRKQRKTGSKRDEIQWRDMLTVKKKKDETGSKSGSSFRSSS